MTRPPAICLGLVLACLAAGCGTDERPNQPPTARLTSAPPDGSEASFRIDLSWTGSDPDGRVDRFEYAVDPPAAFTEDEIAHGGPDVMSEVVPGENGAPAVTRITKTLDGGTISFDWVHTTDTGGTFTFSATRADSSGEDTLRAPTGRFTGMHAFYLRAVDDDGAASVPDRSAFTATTLAPVSRITRPAIDGEGTLRLGNAVSFAWTAQDPDGDTPSAYLYRVIVLPTESVSTVASSVFFDDPNSEWIRTTEPSYENLGLNAPAQFIFAVRAVDAAGAVEPFVDWGRNAFRFVSYPLVSVYQPRLTVTEAHIGTVTFPLSPHRFVGSDARNENEFEVLAGKPLRFAWAGSATDYAAEILGYSWGLDIVDLEDDSAWTPWGLQITSTPDIVLQSPGVHHFYLRVRDTLGATTVADVLIRVTRFVGDLDLLHTDDSFDDTYPRDSEHDDFWRARIEAYGRLAPDRVGEFHFHLDNDRGSIHPRPIGLADLVRYKIVLWVNRGSGFDGDSGLLHAVQGRLLSEYLGAGGKLWLGGRMTIAATIPDATGLRGDFIYPKSLHPGQFAWDVLKIRSDRILNDRGQSSKNNLIAVLPFPGQDPPIYSRMDVDPAKQSIGLRGLGVPQADAVLDPLLAVSPGVLEPLYAYVATGPEVQDRTSDYQGLLAALRWHDPDPAREQGRIQWFGFPLYFFRDDQAQETFNRSLDWFREEPAAP